MRQTIERHLKNLAIGTASITFLVGAWIIFTPWSLAAISCPTKTTGQTLTAANWMACRADVIAMQAWDSSGLGSNYIQLSHTGTDALIANNTGDIRINAVTGQEVELEVNGTNVVVVGSAGITASQTIAGAGNLGITGSVEVDGRTQLDGLVDVNGVTTMDGATTFSSTTSHTGNVGISPSLEVDGDLQVDAQARFTSSTASSFTNGLKLKASGAGSTTLDHYETGTFTPTLAYATVGTSSWTFSNQVGYYTRIGNMMHIHATVVWSAHTVGTGTGNLQLSTLPYTCNSSSNNTAFGIVSKSGITVPTGGLDNMSYCATSTTVIRFHSSTVAGASVAWDPATAGFAVAGTGFVQISIWVRI